MNHIQTCILTLCSVACSLHAIPYGYWIHNPEILQQKTNDLVKGNFLRSYTNEAGRLTRLEKINNWSRALVEAGPMYDKYADAIQDFVAALRNFPQHKQQLHQSANNLRAIMKRVLKDAAHAKERKLIGNTSHIDLDFLQQYVLPVVEAIKKQKSIKTAA